ncbi:hypothetical protein ACFQJD_16690 [Haloplanus sp. GCM10025708]|uniref:hypothetical protein n=1 Tax=Haloplanus sp. GCM10025708 TaxID=3252679 RepID=UPI00361A2528
MSDTTSTYQINEIFYRPINRKIDRVVKVDNDDPSVVKKELEEYILTPQLERHFSDALRPSSTRNTPKQRTLGCGFPGSSDPAKATS